MPLPIAPPEVASARRLGERACVVDAGGQFSAARQVDDLAAHAAVGGAREFVFDLGGVRRYETEALVELSSLCRRLTSYGCEVIVAAHDPGVVLELRRLVARRRLDDRADAGLRARRPLLAAALAGAVDRAVVGQPPAAADLQHAVGRRAWCRRSRRSSSGRGRSRGRGWRGTRRSPPAGRCRRRGGSRRARGSSPRSRRSRTARGSCGSGRGRRRRSPGRPAGRRLGASSGFVISVRRAAPRESRRVNGCVGHPVAPEQLQPRVAAMDGAPQPRRAGLGDAAEEHRVGLASGGSPGRSRRRCGRRGGPVRGRRPRSRAPPGGRGPCPPARRP